MITDKGMRDVPDPAELGFKAPKWSKALATYQRLQRERTETLAMQGDLRRRMGEAQVADNTAYADAIRAGKADPGTPNTDAVKSEQQAVERRAAALTVAVQQAERELVAAVESEADALLPEIETAIDERRAALAAAVEAWAEARARHAEALALREYVSQFPEGRYKPTAGWLRVPRRGDGMGAPPYEQVLAMLRTDAEPPQEPVRPPKAQPLQPTLREIGVSPYGNIESAPR